MSINAREDVEGSTVPQYDPLVLYDDPYPLYSQLRRAAPLYYNQERQIWVLSRFLDVQGVARMRDKFSSADGVALDDEREAYDPGGFIDQDPPAHDRLRGVIAGYFSPKHIARLEATVRAETRRLLTPLLPQGRFDAAADFARPLPTVVICSILGFPRADHSELTSLFVRMLERAPGATQAPETARRANAAMREYIADAVRERIRHTDRSSSDLLSALITGAQAGQISSQELVGITVLLFYAGIITTAGLIANSLYNLLRYTEQRHLLAAQPALLPAAVEELLRYDAPVQSLSRVALCDSVFYGRSVPAGSRILLLWGSANRDERRWDRADELDVLREHKRHLAFGEGIHHCVGAPLARLEGRIALEEILRAMPDYELDGEVERLFTPHERGLSHLPLRFDAQRLDSRRL